MHAAQKVSKFADTHQQKVSAYTKLSGELNGMNARQTYVHLPAPFASLAVSCGDRRCSFAWLGLSIIRRGGMFSNGVTLTRRCVCRCSGNLMSADLVPPIVDEGCFIENRGSEYCSSVFCVIQKGERLNFEATVGGISPAILYPQTPTGAIKCLKEDEQFALYVLWVLNDSTMGEGDRPNGLSATPKSDLLKALREHRWQFRDEVEWDPEAADVAKRRLNELDAEKKQEEARLAKWIDAVFSEAYINYTHLKAINVFIEAVLRYGLDADGHPKYAAYVVEPRPKQETKVRTELAKLYESAADKAGEGEGGMLEGRREYFPYVSETVSCFKEE